MQPLNLALVLFATVIAASDASSPALRFDVWTGHLCPSLEEQLPALSLPTLMGERESQSAGRCSMLCYLNPDCKAVCLQQPVVSDEDDGCRLFTWEKFDIDSSTRTLDCSVYAGGCFVAYPELIPALSCSQSSVNYGGHCSYGIDGNFIQDYYAHPCSHTQYETDRWWRMTFAWRALVTSVTIYNRVDQNGEWLDDFDISVDGQVCASFALNGSPPFSVRSFPCNRTGSGLQISSQPVGILTLCEVQAWGFATGD